MKKSRKPDVPARILPDQRKPYDLPPPPAEPDPSQPPSRQEDPPSEEPERGSLKQTRRQRTSRSSIEQPLC